MTPDLRARLESVDVVRGVIMIVMALDHTRDFFGIPGQNPTDLTHASAALFFTRWVTHFCAPVFFLLTGTGAGLSLRRKSRGELSRYLATRGLWLIVLEVSLLRCFGYQFNVDYRLTMLVVLWALGWAMIALSALVWLPAWLVPTIGIMMIATHNLLDPLTSANPIWVVLHRPGVVLNASGHMVFAAYPLVPWVGVTAAGFGLARIYTWTAERRRTWLLWIGTAVSVAFVAIRAINHYGDPFPWARQRTELVTVLSFLNTTKYPPSLLFLLMTLGPALLFLRAVDAGTPRFLRPALVVGKVPMFYYALHFPLIHLVALATCAVRYGAVHWMFESPDPGHYPFSAPPGWGFSLPIVYSVWAFVVMTMYPLCRWFAAVKQRRRDVWLRYL